MPILQLCRFIVDLWYNILYNNPRNRSKVYSNLCGTSLSVWQRQMPCQAKNASRGFFKEILELHKRGDLGDGVPQKRSWNTLSFTVINFNGIFEQFYAYQIYFTFTCMQSRSIYRVGQARNKWHQNTKLVYYLFIMYGNRFEFAGIFILKVQIYTVFRDIVHLPSANFTE